MNVHRLRPVLMQTTATCKTLQINSYAELQSQCSGCPGFTSQMASFLQGKGLDGNQIVGSCMSQ